MTDVGVHKNGHIGYLESSSDGYFKVVETWIAKQAKTLGRYDRR